MGEGTSEETHNEPDGGKRQELPQPLDDQGEKEAGKKDEQPTDPESQLRQALDGDPVVSEWRGRALQLELAIISQFPDLSPRVVQALVDDEIADGLVAAHPDVARYREIAPNIEMALNRRAQQEKEEQPERPFDNMAMQQRLEQYVRENHDALLKRGSEVARTESPYTISTAQAESLLRDFSSLPSEVNNVKTAAEATKAGMTEGQRYALRRVLTLLGQEAHVKQIEAGGEPPESVDAVSQLSQRDMRDLIDLFDTEYRMMRVNTAAPTSPTLEDKWGAMLDRVLNTYADIQNGDWRGLKRIREQGMTEGIHDALRGFFMAIGAGREIDRLQQSARSEQQRDSREFEMKAIRKHHELHLKMIMERPRPGR